MPSPIVMFQINTADMEASRHFYGALFDWDFDESPFVIAPTFIDPRGPADFDPRGAFMPLEPGDEPFISVFIRVADLWETVDRAEGLGAEILTPVSELANGAHYAEIRSPEGHRVGIVQQ